MPGPLHIRSAAPLRSLRGAALLLFLLTGCGYRFTAGGGALPGNLRTVWAPMFLNRTSEPGADALFTDAFREELLRSGREGGEASDGVVRGEVTVIAGGPAVVESTVAQDKTVVFGSVISYRVNATAVVRLFRGEEQLAQMTVSGGEAYLPGANILEAEANRRAALRRLAGRLMRQAYEGLAAGF